MPKTAKIGMEIIDFVAYSGAGLTSGRPLRKAGWAARAPGVRTLRDIAPGTRDMVPGSSGGDFEPAAGRTGGQGPRRFKFQTGALCSDSRSEVRGGSAPRGGTYRFTVVHIPGVKFHGGSVTERRRRCAAMGQPALDLRD